MKNLKRILSPSQKMALERDSLSEEEYSQLSELFKRFKETTDKDLKDKVIDDIQMYIDRFPLDSKVVFYFNNWSKTSIQSDSYMCLIFNLQRLSESLYGEKYFLRLL